MVYALTVSLDLFGFLPGFLKDGNLSKSQIIHHGKYHGQGSYRHIPTNAERKKTRAEICVAGLSVSSKTMKRNSIIGVKDETSHGLLKGWILSCWRYGPSS